MRLFLDVTRTLAHLYHPAPSGIDRVEAALVRRLTAGPPPPGFTDIRFVVLTPGRQITLAPPRLADILARRDRAVAAGETARGDGFAGLCRWLAAPLRPPTTGVARFAAPAQASTKLPAYWQILKVAARAVGPQALVADGLPSIYLHTSHILLEKRHLFRWLDPARIRPAIFVHDLIPIDLPEFCGVRSAAEHEERLRTVSQIARLVLVNSKATAERLAAWQARNGLPQPPVRVVPLPGEIGDDDTGRPAPPAASDPYFLCAGTIEGRKNLGFLLAVWRGLVERLPEDRVPRLVIAGRRGWACDDVLATLDRSRALSRHVAEANDLADGEIVALMRGARAVLAPSLAEGFGLVPVEAASLGLPVIASDIPAHRETLQGRALLLDPTDGPGWREAILRLADGDATGAGDGTTPRGSSTGSGPPGGWAGHADRVLAALAGIGEDR